MAPLVHVAVASLTLVLAKTLVELLSERFRSSLEYLPGPPPLSWLRGTLSPLFISAHAVESAFFFCVVGHMDQLFHPQGWDFHLKTVAAFGTAVRLRGFLGVRIIYLCLHPRSSTVPLTRESGRCFVFD